jgi:hypothetical protein
MDLKADIERVLKEKTWMIRADNDGFSVSEEANGFEWNDIGEWTEAPDWKPTNKCGHGLHGQNYKYGGLIFGKRVVFCEYDPSDMVPLCNKIKVRRARILMIGLPDNLSIHGDLDLSYTDIAQLPDNLFVGEDLDIDGTRIAKIPNNVFVGGNFYLWGTPIEKLPDTLVVRGCIHHYRNIG